MHLEALLRDEADVVGDWGSGDPSSGSQSPPPPLPHPSPPSRPPLPPPPPTPRGLPPLPSVPPPLPYRARLERVLGLTFGFVGLLLLIVIVVCCTHRRRRLHAVALMRCAPRPSYACMWHDAALLRWQRAPMLAHANAFQGRRRVSRRRYSRAHLRRKGRQTKVSRVLMGEPVPPTSQEHGHRWRGTH